MENWKNFFNSFSSKIVPHTEKCASGGHMAGGQESSLVGSAPSACPLFTARGSRRNAQKNGKQSGIPRPTSNVTTLGRPRLCEPCDQAAFPVQGKQCQQVRAGPFRRPRQSVMQASLWVDVGQPNRGEHGINEAVLSSPYLRGSCLQLVARIHDHQTH